jgi:CBS domain-containing protein
MVRDAMSTSYLVIDEGHSLADALDEMERNKVRAMSVIAGDGSLKGLLVWGDGREALRERRSDSLTAGEICRADVSVGLDEPLQAALAVLESEQVGHVPVVDGRNPVGGISRADIRLFHERERIRGLEPHERSRVLWRRAEPHEGLTWGRALSGEAFIAKAEAHGVFGADKKILEIGPGYGRLLREVLSRKLPFKRYVGVDISPTNVEYLSREFERGDFEVVYGDIETVSLQERFDAVLSSLTVKHLYPTFENTLRNVERYLNPGATVVFDLIEGTSSRFSRGENAFVREYSRSEVEEILSAVPLELVAFDEVDHDSEHLRLLVVAQKPSRGE